MTESHRHGRTLFSAPLPSAPMTATLPYPPSVNSYWTHDARGRTFLSAEAKQYKRTASFAAIAAGLQPIEGDVALAVDVYRPRKSGDLDNTLKGMLDAIRGIAYVDDSQVVEIHARRFDDKNNPRAEIACCAVEARVELMRSALARLGYGIHELGGNRS